MDMIINNGFARFTQTARDVISESKALAVTHRHTSIGVLHLIISCLRVKCNLTVLLKSVGVDNDLVIQQLINFLEAPSPAAPPGDLPFTPAAKLGLENGLAFARMSGCNYIDPLHLLCGSLEALTDIAVRDLLDKYGISTAILRQRMFAMEEKFGTIAIDAAIIKEAGELGTLYQRVSQELAVCAEQRGKDMPQKVPQLPLHNTNTQNIELLIDLASEALQTPGAASNFLREMETSLRLACLSSLETVREKWEKPQAGASDKERAELLEYLGRLANTEEVNLAWVSAVESQCKADPPQSLHI